MSDQISIDSLIGGPGAADAQPASSSGAPAPIRLSDRAARKVGQLAPAEAQAKDLPAGDAILRVYIQGGGCSGFQYGFTFETNVAEDDMVVDNGPVRLVVDPMSFQYLLGSEVDYKEDLEGARFVINNPNATTTCGCGSSFSI